MPIKTERFDAAEFITDPKDQAELLSEALASGSAAYITNAIGVIARARGMAQVAEETGMSRSGLYKAFGDDGDPRLSTLVSVMKTLNMKLIAQTA